MSHISELADEEQDRQNHSVQEIINRRRAKKQKVQTYVNKIGDKQVKEDELYQQTLLDLRKEEAREKQRVD
jgi:hypothetical protein